MARTTLRRFEVFVAVVDAGGFRACSDRLDISPAAVSHQVAQLEEELGYRLFIRRRGRVGGLTEQGVKAYGEARELLEHAGAVEKVMGGARQTMTRRLSVLAEPILDMLLAKHIATFVSEHPTIDVSLKCANFEEIVDSLGKCEADIAYFYSVGPTRELTSEFAWWEPISICARHDHPIFSKPSVTFQDLQQYSFVAPTKGSHFRRTVDNLLRQHGVEKYKVVLEASHANIAREAVINGSAISAVITRYLDEDLMRYGVRPVAIDEGGLGLEVRRAVRSDLVLDSTTRAFAHCLDQTAPGAPPPMKNPGATRVVSHP